MQCDPPVSRPRLRVRRTAGARLRDSLCDLALGKAAVASHNERNWASITFAGARHRIELAFDGAEAVEAGEHFIAGLPDHEFAIPGQLVADATIVAADHRIDPPRLLVTCELLLLEDA